MAVVIRMKRTGRRNAPCYRISVADKRAPRDGRTLETLGVYDPISPVPDLRLKLDAERARHWLRHGALPSETVRSIFERSGVYEEGVALPKKRRDRPGRKKKTSTRARRQERKRTQDQRKAGRREERLAARRLAAKAAAAAEGGESS